jgi:DNA-binding LacI/PurR family transcriptional regulator
MQDVAAHAGVSPRTVSNVVNGYIHVSPAMRARVQRSLDELGYKMDYLARGLKSGRTGFIALVVPSLDEPYFAHMAQAVVQAATARGHGILVEMTGNDLAAEQKILQEGTANVADGVLLCHLGHPLDSDNPSPAGFPLVIMGEHCPGPHLDHVGTDDVAAARAAVNHLIESGRRRIAMIGSGLTVGDAARLRYQGYREALAAARLKPAARRIVPHPGGGSWAAGKAEMDIVLSRRSQIPDAVFALNDGMAIGAMRSLSEHGLRVPEDIAIIGVDDIAEAAYQNPPLSSVALDQSAMANRALDLLEDQIQPGPEPRTPRHEFTPFRLVIRESSAPK